VKASTRRGLKFLAVLALIAVGVIAFLRSQFAWDRACTLARHELARTLGMDVAIGRCEIDPLAQTVKLFDISASLRGSDRPLFGADSLEVRIAALRPFWWNRADFDQINIGRPRLNLDLSQTAPAKATAGKGRCAFDVLRQVTLRRVDLQDGEIHLQLPGGRSVEIAGLEARWRLKRGAAEIDIEAGQGSFSSAAGELPLSRLVVGAILFPDEPRLDIARSEITLGDSGFSLKGSIEQLCAPTLRLDSQLFLSMKTLAAAGLVKEPVEGKLWVRISADGRAAEPAITAKIAGTQVMVDNYRPGDFSARLSYAPGELKIDELSIPFGSGGAKISGNIKLTKNFPIRLKADVDSAQFARILEKAALPGAWVDFPASGRVAVSGHLLPTFQLSGEADIKTGKFMLATRAFDAPPKQGTDVLTFKQSHVQLAVRFLPDRVEMRNVKVETGNSHVTGEVTLFIDPKRGILANAVAQPLDLSDFGEIAGFPATGVGTAKVDIVGPYREVRLDSTTSFRDLDFWYFSLGALQGNVRYAAKVLSFAGLSGQKGKTSYSASGELRFGRELFTTWNVLVPRGHTEDLVDAIVGLHPSIELFQGASTGRASGSVHISSPVSRLAGTIDFDLADTTYYGRRLGEGRLSLRFVDGEALVLEKSSLSGPLGELTGHGRYSFDGPLDFRFRGDRISVAELAGAERAKRLGVSGTATLVGRVAGDSTTPEVTGYLTSPQINFGEKSIGEGHLEGRIRGRDLEVWGRPFRDARGSAKVKLKEPYPYEANLTLALTEIRPFLPPGMASQGLSGALDAAIAVQGELADRATLSLSATLEKLRLARGDFAGENDGPVAITYADGKLDVDTLTFRGPNTQLSISGSAGPTQLDIKTNGTLDMRLLESFVPAVERSSGRLDVAAGVGGTLKDPSLLGSADINDARLSLRDYPLSLRGVSGRIEFSEARVLFQDLRGVLNDGRVSLRGNVRLERMMVKSMELSMQLDEVSARPRDYLPMTLTGELSLYGKPDALVLAGDMDIVKLRYEQPLVAETLLAQFQKAQSNTLYEPSPEWLSFDVGIHARGDVRIDNNLARAKLVGDLRLTGSNARPGLLGTIQAADGSQAFFRGNQFVVTQGTLEFRERRSIDAVFDLHAEAQVREYLVRLHAFGHASDPKVLLSSEPQLSEGDILSLLTLGVTSRDPSNTARASAGLAAEALFTASGLDRQVQRFLPKNPVLRDFTLHISTNYNDYSGVVEPNWQFESKFLTEQLKLRFTEPFSGRGRKAQAEYRFDNRISAQAQWDNENRYYGDLPAGLGNLGLNLKLHWEVD